MGKTYTIYMHKCKTTGKCYIGQTVRKLETRWGINGTQYTKKHNLKFYNAIQKYGWKDFDHYILAKCSTQKEAYEYEQYYIDKFDTFKNGYNSTLGGAGSRGKKMSEETKKKLSEKNKGKSSWVKYAPKEKLPMYGKHHSDETKKKIGNANRGRVISKESRERMSLAKLGKKRGHMSEETRRKIGLAHIGKPCPNKGKRINHPHCVPVEQYDTNGTFIKEYKSIHEAEQETGAKQIARSIKLGIKAGHYIWKRKK